MKIISVHFDVVIDKYAGRNPELKTLNLISGNAHCVHTYVWYFIYQVIVLTIDLTSIA